MSRRCSWELRRAWCVGGQHESARPSLFNPFSTLTVARLPDFADVSVTCDSDSPVALTASPHLKSRAEICIEVCRAGHSPRTAV
ncbi:hypothetical protein FA95DRAFT_1648583 [Auriscalpium vulgare]|uniref:Uncharacterized protein n=1 Tax=Auriscalpium vulgare TaxID=40419 RepID=A0ACB8R9D6_9AGAM|nr:hypothetical protein FA95DRAFT_1648583 [Auriscalpium vulgare]